MKRIMDRSQEIERSVIKKFRRSIWNRMVAGIKDYQLLKPGDRVAVCVSGGTDSMLLAKAFQHLQKYSEIPFEALYLTMDPGYAPANRALIEENAKTLGLELHIFETRVFNVVAKAERSPCYLCARMRRGFLYANAQKLGCNKIALGHHFDDVIETALMSMLYSGQYKTMMPKLHSLNFPGMELIRPLYQVREADIIAWANYNRLRFLQCACRFTEENPYMELGGDSKRAEVKGLLRQLRAVNSQVDINIFQSLHNVDLETVIGCQRLGARYSFLDDYDDPDRREKACFIRGRELPPREVSQSQIEVEEEEQRYGQ